MTGGTLTGTLTGTTINATTLQQGGTAISSLFAAASHNHDASNITTGTLGVARGGTGTSTLSANKVLVGNGINTILQPSGLHLDSTNTRLGVNTSAPIQTLDVSGNIRVTGTILEGDSTDTTRAISCLDSTMGANGYKFICIGKANTSRNQAEISYNHTADGSNGNHMNLGLHSVPVLDLFGDASARFRGNLTVNSSLSASSLNIASRSFRVDFGYVSSFTTDSGGRANVLFNVTFTNRPSIVCTQANGDNTARVIHAWSDNSPYSSFNFRMFSGGSPLPANSNISLAFSWIAIGPA